MGSIFRVLLGLIAAFLAAGLVEAAFIITPFDLARLSGDALSARLQGLGTLALLAATQSATFVGPPALVALVFAERRRIKSPVFYVLLGFALAGAGFLLQAFGEEGAATVAGPYVLTAYAATGFAAGLVYWWVAGHGAGGRQRNASQPQPD